MSYFYNRTSHLLNRTIFDCIMRNKFYFLLYNIYIVSKQNTTGTRHDCQEGYGRGHRTWGPGEAFRCRCGLPRRIPPGAAARRAGRRGRAPYPRPRLDGERAGRRDARHERRHRERSPRRRAGRRKARPCGGLGRRSRLGRRGGSGDRCD